MFPTSRLVAERQQKDYFMSIAMKNSFVITEN